MGDIPIFVAHDSADVWAHPELFHLDDDGRPAFLAGVPPDYFSATGQLWGNPLYRWDALARTGYAWWIDRLRAVLALVDRVRLDHFRGFEAYWEVPGDAATAVDGRWVKGPGAGFFEALLRAFGELPIVAEDLGVITPEVEALRDRFGFPGMAILQFAFGADAHANDFLPAQLPEEQGRLHRHARQRHRRRAGGRAGVGDTTRTRRRSTASTSARSPTSAATAARSTGTSSGRCSCRWPTPRSCRCRTCSAWARAARMNLPGRPGGNWRWRFAKGALTPQIRRRLRLITEGSGRTLPPPSEGQEK